MRILVSLLLLSLVTAQFPAVAEERADAGRADAVAQPAVSGEFAKRAFVDAAAEWGRPVKPWIDDARLSAAQQATQQRGWIERHPILLGALVGAGAGAGVGYAAGQECTGQEIEPCSSRGRAAVVGAGLFAGIGALVGWVVKRVTQ